MRRSSAPRTSRRCAGWLSGSASVLLDSVTALLAEEMFQRGSVDAGAPARVRDGLLRVADAFSDIVFVSDFLFSDARRYDTLTEAYRRGLALCDRALARAVRRGAGSVVRTVDCVQGGRWRCRAAGKGRGKRWEWRWGCTRPCPGLPGLG